MITSNAPCRFRDVVVVLRTLDPDTRDELLACFDPAERSQLLSMLESGDVLNSEETSALIGELLQSLRWTSPRMESVDRDGLDLEQWSIGGETLGECRDSCADEPATLADPIDQALASLPIDGLVRLLEPQHPQLVAATLKLLQPHQRQLVLRRYTEDIQQELAERIIQCGELHPDISMELRCELMNSFTVAEDSAHGQVSPRHAIESR